MNDRADQLLGHRLLFLARHGETDWNREGRFQGHADPPLNGTGRAQAAQLAAGLADVELSAVYSSPLRRALETARVVAAAHELEAVALDALREVDVGSWQGLTRADAKAWADDLRKLGKDGEYFFSLNRYYFLADKP